MKESVSGIQRYGEAGYQNTANQPTALEEFIVRIRCTREGLWVRDRWFRVNLIPKRILLLYLLAPVCILACLLLALNRSTNFKWFLHHHPFDAMRLFVETSRTCVENIFGVTAPPEISKLPTLELIVPQNTLSEMHRASVTGDRAKGHGEGGDRPYFRAWFRDESGQTQKAKIAYRGLMHYHHWPEKPSLRVKIRKADIARGQRYVELSRPKDALGIRHQLPEELARQMGMVTTLNEPVRLFINRKYFGVYLRSYRPGESLALANGRMPGAFFKGDAVGPKENINLWGSSRHWDVYGEKDKNYIAHMERFLETLRQKPSIEQLKKLSLLLDEEVAARFSAIMIVTGCVHTDQKHNQMYYLCSNQGLLEQVPWDPTCYEVADKPFTPVDTMNTPLLECLMRNPHWVHRRNRLIHQLTQGIASAESMISLVENKYNRMIQDLKADAHLSKKTIGTDRFPISVWETEHELDIIKQWAAAKPIFLERYLDQALYSIKESPENPNQSIVDVFGTVAVKAMHQDGVPLSIRDQAGGEVDLLYPGLSQSIEEFRFQPEEHAALVPHVTPALMTYVIDSPPDRLRLVNAITGKPAHQIKVPPSALKAVRTFSPSLFVEKIPGDVVLGPGEVVLRKDIFIGPQQRLIIRPGTVIRLAAGISIFCHGQVDAVGTHETPIEFLPLGNLPWGCFGLSGSGTRGSRIEHAKIANGSIGVYDGIRFKGMLNVYDCPEITLRHCRFGKNFVGDDCVNLAESNIDVHDCFFENSASDGLDLDMCTGIVTDCHFLNCGNDGLDMMACVLSVKNCQFELSGDKGVSVGEGTRVVIRDGLFLKCKVGIEVKDNSHAAVLDSTFLNNQLGYHSYRKKWLYPRGGVGFLVDCKLANSKDANLSIKKQCTLTLLRTPVSARYPEKQRINRVESIPATWSHFIEEIESP